MDLAAKLYRQNIADYEKHLTTYIQKQYAFTIQFLTILNWGYTTTAYYMETDKGNFVCRISNFSEKKSLALKKDIEVSNILKGSFEIPTYINATNGESLLHYEDLLNKPQLLRVSDHVPGLVGFNISLQNVEEMAQFLQRLHYGLTPDQQANLQNLFGTPEGTFLHGDLTPTNCLISYGKVVRVVDFEHAFFGPVEYDLARTAVFCWFHLNELKFNDIYTPLLQTYGKKIDFSLLAKLASNQALGHFENVKKSKNRYTSLEKFEEDLDFAQLKKNELTQELKDYEASDTYIY